MCVCLFCGFFLVFNYFLISDLTTEDFLKLTWILSSPFHMDKLDIESRFQDGDFVVEIGPRFCIGFTFSVV